MNSQETALLIRAVKALCPAQKFDEFTPDMWEATLADTDFADAKTAIIALRRASPWIGPSEIDAEVRRMRTERLDRIVEPPPNVVEGVKSPEEIRALRKAIADGLIPDQDAATRYTRWGGSLHLAQTRGAVPSFAGAPVQPLPQRPVAELIAGAFQRVPPADPEPAFRYDHEAEQRRKDAAAQHRSAVHADAQRALEELRRHRADIGLPDPDLEEAP